MGKKRIFAVSDMHGYCSLLKEALISAGYDPQNEEHLLVCCGDYFDRGNENVEVMKFFERQKRCVLLRGNHEDMLLKLLRTGKVLGHHYINGTMQTLTDFFGKYSIGPIEQTIDFSGKSRITDRLCDFINETVDYFETKNYVFVHGWFPPDRVSEEDRKKASAEEWEKARWVKWTEAYNGEAPIPSKTVVCGHMPTFYADKFDKTRTNKDSEMFFGKGLIAIDAGTHSSQRINVLVLEDELIDGEISL